MIQRIQSLYLVLSSFLSFGIAHYLSNTFFEGSLFKLLVEYYVFYILPMILDFILFLFKKRKLQIMLTTLVMLLHVLFLGVLLFENASQILSHNFAFPILGGIGVLLGLFKANFHIRKDEELVRSVDRIR